LGIGTLIVFIALVLVAAISAVVIIRAAYMFRDQAQQTATGALNEASGPFDVRSIIGDRDPDNNSVNSANIDAIYIVVSLWSGSPAVDMKGARINFANASASQTIFLDQSGFETDKLNLQLLLAGPTNYTAQEIPFKQPNSGWEPAQKSWVLQGSNMLKIVIDLRGGGEGIGINATANMDLTLTFIRGSGPAGQQVHINTPPAFFNSRYIDLT
jgi:archaellin